MAKFNPNQPRAPRGTEEGGQWISAGAAARKAAGLSAEARNENEEELKNCLAMVDRVSSRSSIESYVLKNGQFYNPVSKPKNIKFGKVRECFSNAAHLVWDNPDEYTYVEGYAFPDFMNIPIHHAWVVDKDNNVIDNTWRTIGRAYFGVPIKSEDLNRVLLDSGTFGVLDYSKKSFRNLVEEQ